MLSFKVWLEGHAPQIVLGAIGAFNPIHRGHTKMFYNAKRYLSGLGYDVIAAYIVPKNQGYIEKKMASKGEMPVPLEHRIQTIKAAVQGTFIKPLWVDIEKGPLTDEQIKEEIQSLHPNVQVYMIVGDDYAKCPNGSPPPCISNNKTLGQEYVSPRTGDPKFGYGFSSTKVKDSLKSGQDAQKYLPPKVHKYITQNRLWGAT